MSRSSQTGELEYDPEIEKTAKWNRKQVKLRKQQEVTSTSSPGFKLVTELIESASELDSSSDSEGEPDIMADNEQTLRQLAAPDINQQPLCITYPTIDVAFELKSGLIHLLPSFHGFSGEDPHKHLKEFHVVCSTMKPKDVSDEQIKLRAFPFSLADRAKDWLYVAFRIYYFVERHEKGIS